MANLDEAFFPKLHQLAAQLGAPAEFFMRLFYLESRLDPQARRPGSRYMGLNQVDANWLKRKGIDPEEYYHWPASRQLEAGAMPFLAEVIHTYLGKAPRSPGVLQALNLYPARVKSGGDAASNILMRASAAEPEAGHYRANKGLDVNKDGAISIGDLDAFMTNLARNDDYQAELARLNAVGPSSEKPVTTSSMGATALLVLAGLAGGAFFWFRRKFK